MSSRDFDSASQSTTDVSTQERPDTLGDSESSASQITHEPRGAELPINIYPSSPSQTQRYRFKRIMYVLSALLTQIHSRFCLNRQDKPVKTVPLVPLKLSFAKWVQHRSIMPSVINHSPGNYHHLAGSVMFTQRVYRTFANRPQ